MKNEMLRDLVVVGVVFLILGGALAIYNYGKSDKQGKQVKDAPSNEYVAEPASTDSDSASVETVEVSEDSPEDAPKDAPKDAKKDKKKKAVSLKGKLHFNGRRITRFSREEPRFWFSRRGKTVRPKLKIQGSAFTAYGLPSGKYTMSVNIDANKDNAKRYPGDFRVTKNFEVIKGEITEIVLDLSKVIHLVLPQDNDFQMEDWDGKCARKVRMVSPLEFAWEHVVKGASYIYSVRRMKCSNQKHIETVTYGKTAEEVITVTLPRSKRGEFYLFKLFAKRKDRTVGALITHGTKKHGWDYRFRIR